jgi:hypothetical protein
MERDYRRVRLAVERLVRFGCANAITAELLFEHGVIIGYRLRSGFHKGDPAHTGRQVVEQVTQFFDSIDKNKFYIANPGPENPAYREAIMSVATALLNDWKPRLD